MLVPDVFVLTLTQVDVKGAPLLGAGVEVTALHMQIARADGLGPQPVEQRHLGPRCDAHCGQTGRGWLQTRASCVSRVINPIRLCSTGGTRLGQRRDK